MLLWLLACTSVLAGSGIPGTKLSGEAIKKILAGNTIHGFWNTIEYHQFFNTDGTTLYKPIGHTADKGNWFVNTNQFCSIWGRAQSCYDVYQDGKKLLWVVSSSTYYASEILAGNQLPKSQ